MQADALSRQGKPSIFSMTKANLRLLFLRFFLRHAIIVASFQEYELKESLRYAHEKNAFKNTDKTKVL